MGLQIKVILITAFTWIIICVVVMLDSKLTVSRDFEKLEHQLIERNILSTQQAFNKMLSTLVLYSQAFSQWDEAYDFMKIKNKKFIDSNFVVGTFTSSNINFLMYYDNNNQLYYGKTFDLSKNILTNIPTGLSQYLAAHIDFLSHKTIKDFKVGIVNTNNGLIVMSSLPVLTSTGLGPSRGKLLMGYYLTKAHFDNLSEVVGMKLTFFPLHSIKKTCFDSI